MKRVPILAVLISALGSCVVVAAPPGPGSSNAPASPGTVSTTIAQATPAAPAPAQTTPAAPVNRNQPIIAGPPAPPPAAPATNVPVPVPAPGTQPAATAQPTNRPAGRVPAFPAFPAAPGAQQPPTTATPVTPGGTPVRPPGAPPAPGQVVPGAPGTQTVGAGAPVIRPDQNEILPAGMIKFKEADLEQVLEIYQDLTGRTVLKPNSLPATKITIRSQTPLSRAEAIQALDSILSMNQITMIPQGEKFVKAVPQAQAGSEAQQFYSGSTTNLPEAGVFVTHMVQLKNAAPNDLVPILQPFAKFQQSILTIPSTSMLVLRDYAENVKRMVEVIEKIDVVPQQEFESVVIPIKYALAGDIAQVLGSLTAGGGSTTTVGSQPTRSGLSTGGGFGNRTGTGGMPGQPGYNPNQQFNQQQTGLTGGLNSGAAGRSSFQQRLQQIVNRAASPTGGGDIFVLGQTKIIADERINALLIFASKSDLVTISNIIDKLDVVLAQVLIEAAVLEVNLGNSLDYGFSYLQTQPSQIGDWFTGAGAIRTIPFLNSSGVNSNVSGGFTYAARIFDLDAVVTAVAGDNRGKILQRPRIQTSHAVEANLFVGQSRPYPTTSYYGGGAFGGYSSIQQLQIGVTLGVLPLVNPDGLVVMDIRQKVESYDGDVDISNVGKVPITSQKEANAKVAVRDRETIMLGGFISNEKSKAHGGVPILKDIPLIGNLFRSTSEKDARRELIVLIRPTVLPTPEAAAAFATEERQRLPGTKEAEQDFLESEKKLLDDTDRRMEKKQRTRTNGK